MNSFFLSTKAREYINQRYNFNTLFNKRSNNLIEIIKKNIALILVKSIQSVLSRQLFVQAELDDYISKEAHNTIDFLVKKNLLGEINIKKVENFNFYVANTDFKDIELDGIVGCGISENRDEAIKIALGELIERYDVIQVQPRLKKLIKSAFSTISDKAVDPEKFNYFNLYKKNDEILWAEGTDFFSKKKVYLPANICYTIKGEPFFYQSTSNGVAIQTSFEKAAKAAIFELIERDSLLCHWYLKSSPPQFDLDSLKEDTFLYPCIEKLERINVEINLLDITTDIGVPATAIVAVFKDMDMFSVSHAAGTDLRKVIKKNFEELLQFTHDLHLYEKPDKKMGPEDVRLFKDTFDYWACKDNAMQEIEFLLSGPKTSLQQAMDQYKAVKADTLDELRKLLAGKGIEIYLYNLTSALSKELGLKTIRAVSPQLIQLYIGYQNRYQHHPGIDRFAKYKGIDNYTINKEPSPFV